MSEPLPLKSPKPPKVFNEKWVRLIVFALAAASFGFGLVTIALFWTYATHPLRNANAGMKLSAGISIMAYMFPSIILAIAGLAAFIPLIGRKLNRLKDFPNAFSALLLFPGVSFFFWLGWRIIQIVWLSIREV